MIAVDILIVLLLIFAVYLGTQRGLVIVSLELASFIVATVSALLLYGPTGALLKHLFSTPLALANVAGFVVVWILVEVACALVLRYTVLKYLHRDVQVSLPNRIGGAILNGVKFVIMLALFLVVFAGLPLTANTKRVVTEAHISKLVLASSGQFLSLLAGGLGRDIGESLNFFTVTAEPESEQRVSLGYTTTGKIDAKSEDAMLVLVNRERTSRGLVALTMNAQARAVARDYSTDMFGRGYFSHINLEGKSPFDRMKAGGVKFGQAGENLALAPTLQLAHQGLMNSPGHRANILNPNYRTVGIGIVDGGAYGLMVTQDFTD